MDLVHRAKDNDTMLRTVHLQSRRRNSKQFEQLLLALHVNTNVRCLCLDHNSIDDEGAGLVADMLRHNKGLETLYIESNMISDAGAQAIAAALRFANTTLRRLCLADNAIGDEGDFALAQMLEVNESLRDLDLLHNYRMSEHALGTRFLHAFQYNATLRNLFLFNLPHSINARIYRLTVANKYGRRARQVATDKLLEAIHMYWDPAVVQNPRMPPQCTPTLVETISRQKGKHGTSLLYYILLERNDLLFLNKDE